jgi:hypothetical protein
MLRERCSILVSIFGQWRFVVLFASLSFLFLPPVACAQQCHEPDGSPCTQPIPTSLSVLSGIYSGIFSGYLVGTPLRPFGGTGLFISDGNGNIRGHETFNLNGISCNYELQGTYLINNDGITGTDDIRFINGTPSGCEEGEFTQSLAVADGGNLILLSNTNNPDVATEQWRRLGSSRENAKPKP